MWFNVITSLFWIGPFGPPGIPSSTGIKATHRFYVTHES